MAVFPDGGDSRSVIEAGHEYRRFVRRKCQAEGAFGADTGRACAGGRGAAPARGDRRRTPARQVRRQIRKAELLQCNLPLEDVEIAQGIFDAAQEKAEAAIKGKPAGGASPRNRNRGQLPTHLPRVERVIEPDSVLCPCGCGEMTKISEDVSERLDLGPVEIHRELITAAQRWIMPAKLASVLSLRMAMRLNSFNLQKKFSMRCRHL